MSLEGRRTRVSSPSPLCPYRPLLPFHGSLAYPIHTHIHPESHFYRPYHMHAYSYGCPRRLNYGLSSRARTTEESADRSRGELVALDARSVPLLFIFFPPFFHFVLAFYLVFPPIPLTIHVPSRLVSGRADANEEDPSSLARPRERIQRFLFANEGIVGSTL